MGGERESTHLFVTKYVCLWRKCWGHHCSTRSGANEVRHKECAVAQWQNMSCETIDYDVEDLLMSSFEDEVSMFSARSVL
ncbi:hypothetical protein DPMN_092139 [Dreissena polymorpha]|uniref:Uncharacterized protein n=1 Tax=Dreissena polymorpha TaxID=45954 RepID=A0A9D4QZR1_DREPO|nr:hypothetical protein DPMN_092139 [Dreissena polymorpha]